MANEYWGECHALCFIENRKGISQIYPKIQEFVQFIHFLAKLRIDNSGRSVIHTFDDNSETMLVTIMYDILNKRLSFSLPFDINVVVIKIHLRILRF